MTLYWRLLPGFVTAMTLGPSLALLAAMDVLLQTAATPRRRLTKGELRIIQGGKAA